MPDTGFSLQQVHRTSSTLADEYRERGAPRGPAIPPAGLAVKLFCAAYGWTPAPHTFDAYDATDAEGVRYLVRARRVSAFDTGCDLTPVHNLEANHFDRLAAALFDANNHVLRAIILPIERVREQAHFERPVHAHRLYLSDDLWSAPGVIDATAALQGAHV